ncbi:MAG: YCF48-related protein [Pseudomonadota bacterium]|nr:YCF48-related protein [Pseudomonadota bacterium]
MSMMRRRVSRVAVGLTVLSALLLTGIYADFKPGITPPVDEPFAGRYRYYGLAVSPENSDQIWLVGSYGQVRISDDGGEHWRSGWTGTHQHLQDAVALGNGTVVAVGNGGDILRSEDSGQTWQAVPGVPSSDIENKLVRIRQAPDGALWAVGVMGAALVSRDEGRSFTQVVAREDMAWNDVGFSENGIWLVGEFGRLSYSPDGYTWRPVTAPVSESLMAVDFRGPYGVIAGLNGVVLTTEDSGDHWTQIPVDSATPALYAAAMDESGEAILGGALGQLFTLNHRTHPFLRTLDGRLAPADVVLDVDLRGRDLVALTASHPLKLSLPMRARASSDTPGGERQLRFDRQQMAARSPVIR